MKRYEVFNELLRAVFGRINVKPASGRIYYSGNGPKSLKYNLTEYDNYIELFEIAFISANPECMERNYGETSSFDRVNSIKRFYNFLRSYRPGAAPDVNEIDADRFAYEAAKCILEVIYPEPRSKSKAEENKSFREEDITKEFKDAIDQIWDAAGKFRLRSVREGLDRKEGYFYDLSYTNDPAQYNYCLWVNLDETLFQDIEMIREVKLRIYVDPDGAYDKNSKFFFDELLSSIFAYKDGVEMTKEVRNSNELYLHKPLSLKRIRRLPSFQYYVTHLDEETIFNRYGSVSEEELVESLRNRAIEDYLDKYEDFPEEYWYSLVNYTEDLLRRVNNLNLEWLYGDSKRTVEKCKEEIEKIVVGYPEIYINIDNCPDEVIIEQLLTILHHAVKEITCFINTYGQRIAQYAVNNDCKDHIKYVMGVVRGEKFKSLCELAKGITDKDDKEPTCLREAYYYTSSTELKDYLDAVKAYRDSLKKQK